MIIEPVFGIPPTNYRQGRDGHPVTGIVDHWIAVGDLDAAVTYFQTPRPQNPTSAHFIVGTTGRIVQLLEVADTAFHAGEWAANLLTVGIEHEVRPDLAATPELYAASAWLHAKLAKDLDIALVENFTVRPHKAIVPTACPGTLDIGRIVREANEEGPVIPIFVGQSVTNINLQVGGVAQFSGIWNYNGQNRFIVGKVIGYTPGVRLVTLYPPADPDADPTLVTDATPAYFVVATRATP